MADDQFFEECDRLLKAGDMANAAYLLRQGASEKLTRDNQLRLARLCRRAGLIEEGLRLLTTLVRDNSTQESANASEIAEYAMLLAWIGSHSEAIKLLNSVDAAVVPEVFLYKAFCHILQWNYAEAAAELRTVVAKEQDPYKLLVAKVNLASALLNGGELQPAENLASANIETARELQAQRLLGNSLEVRSQIWLRREQFDLCDKDLADADLVLHNSPWDKTFIHKWRSISGSLQAKNPRLIHQFREQAVGKKQWESLRETDFYLLKIHFERYRFDHLFIGTPYPNYRSRILNEFNVAAAEGFNLGGDNKPGFNSETGEGAEIENPGSKICLLIRTLTRDLYAPIRLGEVFAQLYPEECFNIHSSPGRVRQLIHRMRAWMELNKTGFTVLIDNGAYRLTVGGAFSLYVPNESTIKDEADAQLLRLSQTLAPGCYFTANEAAQVLSISRSQFSRYAKTLLARGRLNRQGAGKRTRYQIPPTAA